MQIRTKALMWFKIGFPVLLATLPNSASAPNYFPPPLPQPHYNDQPDTLGDPKSLRQVGLPVAQTRAAIPLDNPQTPEKIALGQRLFFEGRLSADGSVACSSCHNPARAFTDGKPVSIGIHDRAGQRNAPTLLNALYNKTQFWDGRAATLEEQAGFPIVNPVEMGQPSLEAAVNRLRGIREYRQAFQEVFGRPVDQLDLLRAIASYERTLVSFNSPFDRFIAGDKSSISESAARGWNLFNGQGRCNHCHALSTRQPNLTSFTDNGFHNIGIGTARKPVMPLALQAGAMSENKMVIDRAAIQSEMSALGRYLVTRKQSDIGAFKTPDLRNVMVTAPYFHNGSMQTLWDVLDHYNKGDGMQDPFLDPEIQPLALTEDNINDLVAFLASLTSDDYKELGARELSRQRAIAQTYRPQRDIAKAFGPKPLPPSPPIP